MTSTVPGPVALFRGLAPFMLAAVLGCAVVGLTSSVDPIEFLAAVVLTVLVVATTVWLPWHRLPHATRVGPSFLFLVAMALLRDAGGGVASGVGALVLLPVFWMALHGTRAQLAAVLAGLTAFYIAPSVLVGGAAYPASGYRTAVIFTVVSAIIGFTVQRLVRKIS